MKAGGFKKFKKRAPEGTRGAWEVAAGEDGCGKPGYGPRHAENAQEGDLTKVALTVCLRC